MTHVIDPRPGFRLTGWHVLAIVVTFFGVVIAVDVAMAVYAYKTFPGEVSVTPYEDGVAYNKTLAQLAAQEKLGWKVGIAPEQSRALEVEFRDRDGKPLDGLTLTGKMERPATETGRLTPKFKAIGPGYYQADLKPVSGAWDVTIHARNAKGDLFVAERRVTWP